MHSAAVLERVHDALLSCVNRPWAELLMRCVRAAITPFMVALCSGIVKASSLRSDAAHGGASGLDDPCAQRTYWQLCDGRRDTATRRRLKRDCCKVSRRLAQTGSTGVYLRLLSLHRSS
jgi:hypothetical protein